MASPADRQRKYRKRQARGVGVYRVPARFDVVEALIESGRLTEAQALDTALVGEALASIAVEWAFHFFVTRNA